MSLVRGISIVALQGAWSGFAAFLRCLSWRRRRLVAGRKRLVACVLVACGLAGAVWAEPVTSWIRGSTLVGDDRLRGQILVRPPTASGAVDAVVVRLIPVAPTGVLTGVLFLLGPSPAASVVPVVDHAGRWSSDLPSPGWGYVVVVAAEGCAPRVVGVVEVFWFQSVRVDYAMASCRFR